MSGGHGVDGSNPSSPIEAARDFLAALLLSHDHRYAGGHDLQFLKGNPLISPSKEIGGLDGPHAAYIFMKLGKNVVLKLPPNTEK